MIKKYIIISIIASIFLSGCIKQEPTIVIKNTTIYIPNSLLSPSKAPHTPLKLSDKEINQYILGLYKSYRINHDNIIQINSIVKKYNKDNLKDIK